MKAFKIILWVSIAFVVSALFGAWGRYDYGVRCSKCLAKKHVVEWQFLGIPLTRRTQDQKGAQNYEGVFGRPCEHVLRQGGFGRTSISLFGGGIGCGMTGEGMLVRPRMDAVSAVYEIHARLDDRGLALETFQFIEELMPADLGLQALKDLPLAAPVTLSHLASYLQKAQTVEDWRSALEAARRDHRDLNKLPAR